MSGEQHLRASVVRLSEEGILIEVVAQGAHLRVPDAEASLAAYAALAGGTLRPILVDARGVHAIERGARRLLSGPRAAVVCSAVALVVGSPLSRVVGNFFVGLNRPGFPVRLFDDPQRALDWLRERLPGRG